MAKINARGAEAVARVKRTFTLEDATVVTQHRVLCSDGRILQREAFRDPDGHRHATGHRLVGKAIAVKASWLAAQLANGWKTE
ncbi:MAG: hypothetical protein ABH877_01800, partial [bacterium]